MPNIKAGPNVIASSTAVNIADVAAINSDTTAEILGISDDGRYVPFIPGYGDFNSLTHFENNKGYLLNAITPYYLPVKVNPSIADLFIYTGESNSGGYALNNQALPSELLARPSVQILNNITLQFEDLHIGVNNKLGHIGHEAYWYTTHGWELGLANRVEAGQNFCQPAHLVKVAIGGSRIADWANFNDPDTNWGRFQTRVDKAINLLEAQGKTVNLYILYSQGINNGIDGTNINTWKAATMAHFDKIRAKYGQVPIVMTKFMSTYATFNTAIDQLVTARPDLYAVNTLDATLRDDNHWDYAGMKLIGQRMENVLINQYF